MSRYSFEIKLWAGTAFGFSRRLGLNLAVIHKARKSRSILGRNASDGGGQNDHRFTG